eukprot:GHVN01050990.1.p3 GENE.GHVN01050990.1~~GHVN01050990.1.p3  ORF type:complete len:106 (-),score=8.09 GHVN01050990.1:1375-1692(-)
MSSSQSFLTNGFTGECCLGLEEEYADLRQLGRATGAIFAVPFCYFLTRKALNRKMVFFLTGLLGFGAFQGLVGWWMVRSGLTEPSTKVKTPRWVPASVGAQMTTA